MIGQALGKYRVVEKLGEGGMGIVYRARDEGLNRNVAVKILPPGALTDEVSRPRRRAHQPSQHRKSLRFG